MACMAQSNKGTFMLYMAFVTKEFSASGLQSNVEPSNGKASSIEDYPMFAKIKRIFRIYVPYKPTLIFIPLKISYLTKRILETANWLGDKNTQSIQTLFLT